MNASITKLDAELEFLARDAATPALQVGEVPLVAMGTDADPARPEPPA